jgi:Putative metallopeptidase
MKRCLQRCPGRLSTRAWAGLLMWACALPLDAPSPAFSTVPTKKGEPNSIDIAYVAPKDPKHQGLYDLLTSRRILEKLQAILAPFRLPARVLLKVEGCNGTANAYSGDGAVTVCYEYIDEIWSNVPSETTPEGVAPIDALAGRWRTYSSTSSATCSSTSSRCRCSAARRTPPISSRPT